MGEGSNPIDGQRSGVSATSPEMGSAKNTPTLAARPGTTGGNTAPHHEGDVTKGATSESAAGEEESNPIDGQRSGVSATSPEMGSAKNTPTLAARPGKTGGNTAPHHEGDVTT